MQRRRTSYVSTNLPPDTACCNTKHICIAHRSSKHLSMRIHKHSTDDCTIIEEKEKNPHSSAYLFFSCESRQQPGPRRYWKAQIWGREEAGEAQKNLHRKTSRPYCRVRLSHASHALDGSSHAFREGGLGCHMWQRCRNGWWLHIAQHTYIHISLFLHLT